MYDNIELFHGDKTKITIYGESAGAGSVSVHLTAPLSWPYFSKAILESGAFSLWTVQDLLSAEHTFALMLERLHCSTVDCLLAQDANALLNASFNVAPRYFVVLQHHP